MSAPPQKTVNLILGPVVTAVTVNCILYGVCVLQFSTYYASGFNDRRLIRFLVFWVFLLDTFHSAASIYLLWVYVVQNFNNPAFLSEAPWPFPSTPIVTAFASCPIQHFLAWRIKEFTKSWYLFFVLSALSVAQGSLAIASAIGALLQPNIKDFARLIPLVDAWLALAVVCDLSITVLLMFHLNKSRTGLRRTDSVITRLIQSSVETAAFGTFFCVMDLITFSTLQNTNFHLIFALPMGRIYTNTLLTTLNSRLAYRLQMSGLRDYTFKQTGPFPDFGQSMAPTTTQQDQLDDSFQRAGKRYLESNWREEPEAQIPAANGN